MTTKYVQPGATIDVPITATIASGDVVVLKHIIGIALKSGVSGDTIPVAIEGVFEKVAKVTAAVFVVGEKLIWDTSASKFDDSSATPATGRATRSKAWLPEARIGPMWKPGRSRRHR